MKRFKKFLIEEMSTDKVAPEATNVTPQSSVTPPAPAMFAPDSVKQQYARTVGQQGPYLAKGEDEYEDEEPLYRGIDDDGRVLNPAPPPKPAPRRYTPLWPDGGPDWYWTVPRREWTPEMWDEYRRRQKESIQEYHFDREQWLKNLERLYGIDPSHPYWHRMYDYIQQYEFWERNGRQGNPPQPPNFPPPDRWQGPMPRFQNYDRNGDGRLDGEEHDRWIRDLDRWAQEFERQLQQG